ncbi:MAG: CapA family protein [candidate division WOR-3 bacterium]|nr:CapA family protein [candidate division WOR-3 bacterium]
MKEILILLLFAGLLFSDTLRIVAVGDIMMGTTYPEVRLPPDDGKKIFTVVAEILKDADLTMGNLEGPLTDKGECTKKIEKGKVYAFRTPPRYAQYLAEAGFDFMNLKNNHINDFGTEGLTSTIHALNEWGIQYGTDEKNGEFIVKNRKICIISFSQAPWGNSILDISGAQRTVAQKAKEYDIVIVTFHGGGEGTNFLHTKDTIEYFLGQPRGNVVKFSRAVIDSGADLVWGHGPHVPRAIEIYKDRLIAYSLGNFFTYGFNIEGCRGYAPILRVALDSTGIFIEGEIISAVQRPGGILEIDSLQCAFNLIKNLSLEDFPETAPAFTKDGKILSRRRDVSPLDK